MKLQHTHFSLPDGQTHIKFNEHETNIEQCNYNVAEISCRITNNDELMNVLYLTEVLRRKSLKNISLKIYYLLGARMDRPISDFEPYTLKVIANVLNSQNYHSVEIFFPHSRVSLDLINNSCEMHKKQLTFYEESINNFARSDRISVVLPDEGAVKRFYSTFADKLTIHAPYDIVECAKKRDMNTGKLSGFRVVSGQLNSRCVILDDLCDGGGTFVGLSSVLREHGTNEVGLVVPHGIFSKGKSLQNISSIYTTNSFHNWETDLSNNFNCWKVF